MNTTPRTSAPARPPTGPIAAVFLIAWSGVVIVDLPALLVSIAATAGILLTASFVVIPATSAVHHLIVDPDARPLAIILGLWAIIVLVNVAWEIRHRIRVKQRRSRLRTPADDRRASPWA
ncbi:hypothetical protein [Bradyrhizobium sp. 2TAF24]|uniref:hypothetical protein n=1 Tax=Bradyrhizobium sp. 2TAF24 TaxID=3233011 RepID=UPI003F939D02